MYRNHTISVSMPCRNEGAHLATVLAAIPAIVDEVIVVSNASSDDSVTVARRAGAQALEDNRTVKGIGYGFAHMTGMQAATGDVIIGIDADGTYPIEKMAYIIDSLIDNDVDFISCSRLERSDIPVKLRLGVQLLNIEVRALYGRVLHDTLSGMWVFRRSIVPELLVDQGDWNFSPQIKLAAMTNSRIRFAEYPIVQHDRYGHSHQRYLRTGLSHAWWIARNWLTHMRQWSPTLESTTDD